MIPQGSSFFMSHRGFVISYNDWYCSADDHFKCFAISICSVRGLLSVGRNGPDLCWEFYFFTKIPGHFGRRHLEV
jgi:hypothetical protein